MRSDGKIFVIYIQYNFAVDHRQKPYSDYAAVDHENKSCSLLNLIVGDTFLASTAATETEKMDQYQKCNAKRARKAEIYRLFSFRISMLNV